jgi:NADH-quinone oxidoreductase subunit L
MGGLRSLIPTTYMLMVIGTLALTGVGIPGLAGFAGFYSKDAIIEAAYAAHSSVGAYAFWMTVTAALMTSFYSWRLIFMTFHGRPRASNETLSHVHESPRVMLVPLVVLAAGSMFAGALFYGIFIGEAWPEFWREAVFVADGNHILEEIHHVPLWVKWSATAMMLIGFLTAVQFYIRSPSTPVTLAREQDMLYRFLLNKWYFDEIYDFLFVRPAFWLGRMLWRGGDGRIIDGLGPDGIAARVVDVTSRVVRLQTGFVYHYAFAMLIGVALLITWYTFAGV